jgi:hypothetical protein
VGTTNASSAAVDVAVAFARVSDTPVRRFDFDLDFDLALTF